MGTNYYIKVKTDYNRSVDTPVSLGIDNDWRENSIVKLTNGYVFKNKYYKTVEELNKDFYQEVHIGKSSYGWKFALAIYPQHGLKTIKDWIKLFNCKNVVIYDEYDKKISPSDMIKTITKRQKVVKPNGKGKYRWMYCPALEIEFGDPSYYKVDIGLLCHNKDRYTTPQKGKTYDYVISGNDDEEGVIFS